MMAVGLTGKRDLYMAWRKWQVKGLGTVMEILIAWMMNATFLAE